MSGRALIVETSGAGAGVAITTGKTVLGVSSFEGRAANVRLLDALDDLLVRTGTRPSDLSAVVACRGPGSFTGVRVGLALARGLARGWGLAARTVTTFDALAARHDGHPGPLLVVLDAKRGELFAQAFGPSSKIHPRASGPCLRLSLGALEPLAKASANGGRGVLVVGTGVAAGRVAIERALAGCVLGDASAVDASDVARADALGRATACLHPLYLRPPDARLPAGQE